MNTQATVKTEFGELYLKKLCRHFAHRVPATIVENQGRIEFPFGPCRIDVDSKQMQISMDVNEEQLMEKAESVVGEHLLRMANKDEPVVEWNRAQSSPTTS